MHCKIKESLLIRDLKPALNENVGSERLHPYYYHILVVLCICQSISLVPSPYSCIFEFKFICNRIIITSDDVCCNIGNAKFIKVLQFKQMFVTAVCVLFLLKYHAVFVLQRTG